MTTKTYKPKFIEYVYAWLVHIFSASAAFIGVLTLVKIQQHEFLYALVLMGITIGIDAVDGSLARLARVKSVLPSIDGALLDNIVDFLNYVITPCFFLLIKPDMLPSEYSVWIIIAITLASTYQFCQEEAKTPDHFFKGFPCYWNFAVFYMFIFNISMMTNALILLVLCALIFVPIKYVYPSRINYLTTSKHLKMLMHGCSILYGVSSAFILWNYPKIKPMWLIISLGYIMMYSGLSLYRTIKPLTTDKIDNQ